VGFRRGIEASRERLERKNLGEEKRRSEGVRKRISGRLLHLSNVWEVGEIVGSVTSEGVETAGE
jgi:hypothetical protein